MPFESLIVREPRHPVYAGGHGNEPPQVYAKLLYSGVYGHAIFDPPSTEASTLDERLTLSAFQRLGLQIGDVGYLNNSGFHRLFNVLDTNQRGEAVQARFPLFSIPLHSWSLKHRPGKVPRGQTFPSAGTTQRSVDCGITIPLDPTGLVTVGGYIEFSSSSAAAAALGFPTGADWDEVENPELMREFILEHGLSWIRYINGELRCNAPNGSILLVTGYATSRSFATAVTSQTSQTRSASFRLTVGPIIAGVGSTLSWSHCSGLRTHVGPSDGIKNDLSTHPQYYPYVKGYLLSVRRNPSTWFRTKLSVQDGNKHWAPFANEKQGPVRSSQSGEEPDAANPANQPSDGTPSGLQRGIAELKNISDEDFHPLLLVNDILLDLAPQAMLALSHDNNMSALLDDGESIPTRETLKERIMRQCEWQFDEKSGIISLDLPPEEASSNGKPALQTVSNRLSESVPNAHNEAKHRHTGGSDSTELSKFLQVQKPSEPQNDSIESRKIDTSPAKQHVGQPSSSILNVQPTPPRRACGPPTPRSILTC